MQESEGERRNQKRRLSFMPPFAFRFPHWGRRRFVVSAAGLVLLIGLGAVGAWLASRGAPNRSDPVPAAPAAPTDPRRTYTGPYRNIDPDVQYAGDASCVGCHEDIARSYARHPMGRSLAPVADPVDRQPSPCPAPTPGDAGNPFIALGRRFQVERQGSAVWHRQAVLDDAGKPVVELAQEVRWVIGSGTKGYSYLTEQDGYLLQTPISWFTRKQRRACRRGSCRRPWRGV